MRVSKKMRNYHKQIGIGECRCEKVSSFRYFGSIINDNNISEEITHRTEKGNKAYNGI